MFINVEAVFFFSLSLSFCAATPLSRHPFIQDKENAKKPKLATSIPRPNTSPARSPVRAATGSQLPSRSMDDLKKQLEMIKKRSRPT